ncbi:hypothetical protein AWENTII_000106 [Aspergillus wentii]
MLGTYEFSDFPMDPATFGVQPGQHIPGTVIQAYLTKYASHFGFTDRIRLNTRVHSAEHRPDGSWLLTTETEQGEQSLVARKLIIATGVTSQAFLPTFDGQEEFDAPLFHCKDLLQEEAVFRDGQRATVFGGTKSAWDAVYACATSGMQVDWVIRESGHGPCWMAPPYVTPLKKWLEKLVTTRFLTWFSPCIWGSADGFAGVRSFLHGTWLGRKIVDGFWSVLANDVVTLNEYDKHPETAKLKPWVSPFWVASSLSILNYPTNFFDLVKQGKVRIHVADIDRLSARTVHLSNGDALSTSALICSTGWKATPNMQFLPAGIDRELGFPWAKDCLDDGLIQQADQDILRRFPRLRNQPSPNASYTPLSQDRDSPAAAAHPFRLSRFMIPLSMAKERSIAFMGVAMTINTSLMAQSQALWIAAYFSDRLTLTPTIPCPPSVRTADEKISQTDLDLKWEMALHTQFGKHRYPGGFGKRNPDFVFDAIPYVDLLLRDLGLSTQRKRGSLATWFEPYGAEDYRGLVQEWKGRRSLA